MSFSLSKTVNIEGGKVIIAITNYFQQEKQRKQRQSKRTPPSPEGRQRLIKGYKRAIKAGEASTV